MRLVKVSRILAALLLITGVALFGMVSADPAPVVDFSNNFQAEEDTAVDDEAATPVFEPPHDSNRDVATPQANDAVSQQDAATLTDAQRLGLLERQVNNMASMNFPQQVALLQEQIAQLRGQMEVQSHNLQLLRQQLDNFYKDLNARIGGHATATASLPEANRVSGNKMIDDAQTQEKLQDNNAYQAAFMQLTQRRYSGAKKLFTKYLDHYPGGKYRPDAYYWLGEIAMISKDNKLAAEAFQNVLRNYPKSSKAPDAELKMAMIHANTGELDKARAELLDITKNYPDSAVAQLANIRLQQLEQR